MSISGILDGALRWALCAVAAIAAVLAVGCNDDTSSAPTSTFAASTRQDPRPTPTRTVVSTPRTSTEEHVIVDNRPATVGDAEADRFFRALESHDVDAILKFVAYRPTPCGGESFPDCPPSATQTQIGNQTAEGIEVIACNQGSAEQTFVWRDDPEQMRMLVQRALGDESRSFIYHATRGPFSKAGDLHYVITVGAGAAPRPDAPATIWQLGPDNKLEKLTFDCRDRGVAAASLGADFARYLLSPAVYCESGPASATVEVIERLYGGAYPELRRRTDVDRR